MADEEKLEITFTKAHVRDFQEHVIWQEITATLLMRIEVHKRELETTSFSDLNDIAKLQGAIKEDRYCLTLPDMMLDELEPITEEEEEE